MTDSTASHPADPASGPGPAPVRDDLLVTVLAVGLDDDSVGRLETVAGLAVESVRDAVAAVRRLGREPAVEVLVTGAGVSPDGAVELIERADAAAGERPPTSNLVLAGGAELQRFQTLVDHDRLWFVCHAPPPPTQVAELVAGVRLPALRRRMDHMGRRGEAPTPGLVDLARRLSRRAAELADDAELVRRLALQNEAEELALLAAQEAREHLGGVRAHCLFHDPLEEILWSPWDSAAAVAAGGDETGDAGMRRESAVAGLASFVLRSGRPLDLERADADPRYDREADDPAGTGAEWVVAVPLPAGSTPLHGPVGVLVVAGEPGSERPDAACLAWLERLAGTVGPLAADLLERTSAATLALVGANATARQLFRDEAMDHHVRGTEGRRDVLRLSPSWARWSYWALLAMVLVGLLFVIFAEVSTHVSGPAVVDVADDGEARAWALLPVDGGGAATAPGMEARLDLAGLDAVGGPVRVATVSSRPITAEAAAELPAGLGDLYDPAEPMMLVSLTLPDQPARPPTDPVGDDGAGRAWRGGLRGTAEVRLGSDKLLFQLVPALRTGGDR